MNILRGARTTALALGAVAVAGSAWQRAGEARRRRDFPAAGRFVATCGGRLHYRLDGDGGPTVVLDSGLGSDSSAWDVVAPRVATFARVARFDRPGLGWSAPANGPRTGGRVASELQELLDGASIPSPYVLVGWSLAGLHARAFAARHPEKVAGVVLVDASHEDEPELLGAPGRGARLALRAIGALANIGLARVAGPLTLCATARQTTTAAGRARLLAPENRSASGTRQMFRAALAETADFAAAQAEARATRAAFPPVPLVVIGRDTDDAHWLALQDDLATLSPRGRRVAARGSNHLIPYDRPDVIVDAIREVVERAREDAREGTCARQPYALDVLDVVEKSAAGED